MAQGKKTGGRKKGTPNKSAGGHPTDYCPEYAPQAEKLCLLGATDKDLADFFGVAERTIYRWIHAQPEFCHALKAGKEVCDDRVERSLYHRATGYKHDAVKIFMPAGAAAPVYAPYQENVPPDTTACIFWLKNRRKGQWRDKQEIEGKIEFSVDEAIQRIADRREKARAKPSS